VYAAAHKYLPRNIKGISLPRITTKNTVATKRIGAVNCGCCYFLLSSNRSKQVWMRSSQVWMRSSHMWRRYMYSQVWTRSSPDMDEIFSQVWMRSRQVIRASDCQCQSCNSPGGSTVFQRPLTQRNLRAADGAVLNEVR
jgi:hypothetical protein